MQVLRTMNLPCLPSAMVAGCLSIAALLTPLPTHAAESINIRFKAAERALSVEDLETFVTTDTIPRSLDWYADRLTEDQLVTLREILQQPLPIAPTALDSLMDSPLGETVLQRLLVLFWGGPNREALLKALRASLILAAVDGEGLTVMNAIRHYPLTKLRIDMDVAARAIRDLKQIAIYSEDIFDAIERKGAEGLNSNSIAELPPNFLEPSQRGNLLWGQTGHQLHQS